MLLGVGGTEAPLEPRMRAAEAITVLLAIVSSGPDRGLLRRIW
jgi:hypothetical protein